MRNRDFFATRDAGARVATLAIACAFAAALAQVPAPTASAADIDTAVAAEERSNLESLASQQRINTLDDQTDAMATEYRSLLDQAQSLRVYNRQLDVLIAAQQTELASLDDQIASVTEIGREVTPLMLRMVETLEQFVEADVPMLLEERRQRVANLRSLLDRADVEDAEKYRRILEAYQIENDYGRTIEAYQDEIEVGGQKRTLEMLRIGRVALLYQTLDGNEVGGWDPSKRDWVVLGDEYRDTIRTGVRIAQKQMAPDMIRVPVAAPKESIR